MFDAMIILNSKELANEALQVTTFKRRELYLYTRSIRLFGDAPAQLFHNTQCQEGNWRRFSPGPLVGLHHDATALNAGTEEVEASFKYNYTGTLDPDAKIY